MKLIQSTFQIEPEHDCGSDSADDEENDIKKIKPRNHKRVEDINKSDKSLQENSIGTTKRLKLIKRSKL